MGLMFTTWAAIAVLYDPTSFSFQIENPNVQEYTYFTFVTMTILRYGEIAPEAAFAKPIFNFNKYFRANLRCRNNSHAGW